MYKAQPIASVNLPEKQNGHHHLRLEQVVPQNESITANDPEVLSCVLVASVQELNHPMRAVLCWSKLMLSELHPHDPLFMDLTIIVQETQRMNEVVRGLNLLTEHQ